MTWRRILNVDRDSPAEQCGASDGLPRCSPLPVPALSADGAERSELTGPVPSESASSAPAASPPPPATGPVAVSDDERNRYGLLLDRAAERGLLSTDEYDARLRDLAIAGSVEELQRIVAELPIFTARSSKGSGRGRWSRRFVAGAVASDPRDAEIVYHGMRGRKSAPTTMAPGPLGSRVAGSATTRRRRTGNPWVALVVMTVVLVVALVVLAIYSRSVIHHQGRGPSVRSTVVMACPLPPTGSSSRPHCRSGRGQLNNLLGTTRCPRNDPSLLERSSFRRLSARGSAVESVQVACRFQHVR
ncbi:MAG: DUF1707 SHOCT-like domain-containing protein [Acidimicrobiales bacterium]